MNNSNQSVEVKSRKDGLRPLAWVLGIMFLLAGLSYLFVNLTVGILFLIATAILLPPAARFLRLKCKLPLTRTVRIAGVVIVSIIILAVGISQLVSAVDTSESTTSTSILPIGSLGYLYLPNSSSNTQKVLVATTKDNEDEFAKLSVASDNVGISEMVLSGQAFLVDQNTQVRVIDYSGFLDPMTEIRIMSGDEFGQSGYVSDDLISSTTVSLSK